VLTSSGETFNEVRVSLQHFVVGTDVALLYRERSDSNIDRWGVGRVAQCRTRRSAISTTGSERSPLPDYINRGLEVPDESTL
jgi:hypothetical protein